MYAILSDLDKFEKTEDILGDAVRFAAVIHAGQMDKGGKPYIFHPVAVASKLKDTSDQVVALLHDTIEDSENSEKVFLAIVRLFGVKYGVAVKSLSRSEDMDYFSYIESLKHNDQLVRVKLADLQHNMDFGRLEESNMTIAEKANLLKRYENAVKLLME